ncbi:hypothetical protein PI124_g9305 [Phytophthora idaei]|nr:hypothetical protein PI125_g19572 [Phytophthora idaei]KAG3142072.1 hypothetical protein PI126_g15212 [Phytophthora idaei]KAG3245969.1 hypothetical protein PI124_g9305 [Phytophthora idaei]
MSGALQQDKLRESLDDMRDGEGSLGNADELNIGTTNKTSCALIMKQLRVYRNLVAHQHAAAALLALLPSVGPAHTSPLLVMRKLPSRTRFHHSHVLVVVLVRARQRWVARVAPRRKRVHSFHQLSALGVPYASSSIRYNV